MGLITGIFVIACATRACLELRNWAHLWRSRLSVSLAESGVMVSGQLRPANDWITQLREGARSCCPIALARKSLMHGERISSRRHLHGNVMSCAGESKHTQECPSLFDKARTISRPPLSEPLGTVDFPRKRPKEVRESGHAAPSNGMF